MKQIKIAITSDFISSLWENEFLACIARSFVRFGKCFMWAYLS